MRRLIWGLAGRTYHIVGNLMHWLKCFFAILRSHCLSYFLSKWQNSKETLISLMQCYGFNVLKKLFKCKNVYANDVTHVNAGVVCVRCGTHRSIACSMYMPMLAKIVDICIIRCKNTNTCQHMRFCTFRTCKTPMLMFPARICWRFQEDRNLNFGLSHLSASIVLMRAAKALIELCWCACSSDVISTKIWLKYTWRCSSEVGVTIFIKT